MTMVHLIPASLRYGARRCPHTGIRIQIPARSMVLRPGEAVVREPLGLENLSHRSVPRLGRPALAYLWRTSNDITRTEFWILYHGHFSASAASNVLAAPNTIVTASALTYPSTSSRALGLPTLLNDSIPSHMSWPV